ncbi:MAG: transposase [Bacteroidales bacterium]|nr:transposase [Bacteroidales bacterium]
MNRFRNKYRVDSTRLKGYDYSRDGTYFITICTKNREWLFGEIVQSQIKLSGMGKIVYDCWYDLPNHYSNIYLDEFIIMPNHIHGIIAIINNPYLKHKHGISEFIRAFKSFSSRRINELFPVDVETGLRPVSTSTRSTGIWQPRFYDRIIRSYDELKRVRLYIKNNPAGFCGNTS